MIDRRMRGFCWRGEGRVRVEGRVGVEERGRCERECTMRKGGRYERRAGTGRRT